MTLVSIITPSFNQAAFLQQTLNSVLQQDHHDLEYLVVDGGSRDGSVDIIRQSASRLAWWVSEPDSGQADAINKALAHARGEVVAWLNSDDYYLPGTVRAAARVFQVHPDAVLVYGNMLAVDEANRITNKLVYQQVSLEDLMCFRIIGQPAAFIRRSALEAVGGLDTSLHMLLDHQLWIRLATVGRMIHVGETWAAARYHPRAKNRASARDFGREAFRILEWMSKEPSLAPVFPDVRNRARASAHRVDARYLVDGGLPLEALKAWLRALLLHPPTALTRVNLLGSALLQLAGLESIRQRVLRRRQDRLAR
ncbi:MAG TPA: glycosyltransferase family 2 protein [Anaerolineales bacterium]|nr:glycosyltransferase family 2 protein [Anaerolineales bacterium]